MYVRIPVFYRALFVFIVIKGSLQGFCLVHASKALLLEILFCIFAPTPVSFVFPCIHLDVTRRFVHIVLLVF